MTPPFKLPKFVMKIRLCLFSSIYRLLTCACLVYLTHAYWQPQIKSRLAGAETFNHRRVFFPAFRTIVVKLITYIIKSALSKKPGAAARASIFLLCAITSLNNAAVFTLWRDAGNANERRSAAAADFDSLHAASDANYQK